MIKNFSHKGLKKFYLTGAINNIQPSHERRLRLILARLDAALKPEDMKLPGFDFHKLSGDMNKSWRVIFKFDESGACDVDYLNYH